MENKINPTAMHDLSLGKWGPYNKQYLGACHIANEELGASFAVELFPAFYRRRVVKASALSDGDARMWGANARRTAFIYRYELEWKDRVYVDAHFNITGDRLVNIDCELVNNTDEPQSLNLFLAAGLEYPYNSINAVKMGYKELCEVKAPDGVKVIDALDYSEIKCSEWMAQDGKYLGEGELDFASGKGTVIEDKKFFAPEHFVTYGVSAAANGIGIRYIAEADTSVIIEINGDKRELSLPAAKLGYAVLEIPETKVEDITVRPLGAVGLDAVCVGHGVERVEFFPHKRTFKPEKRVEGNSMTLKYGDSEYEYRIEWDEEPLMLRTLYTDDVGILIDRTIHDHVQLERRDTYDTEGVYEVVRTKPTYLAPHSSAVVSFRVISTKTGEGAVPERAEQDVYRSGANSDGKGYAFANDMMAYNVLLNVVYPIYTRRGYIRHSAPGRLWNCLYTWDSGMIGIGLSTVEFESAYENLRAYLTPVGDKHSPYIFHGSVVPTQIFLYHELVSKYPEKKSELLSLYPMVMQYYGFFSGLSEGKEQMKSGILKTWHIFYNSGGWDDYPPQKYTRFKTAGRAEKHDCTTTPVITTALAVLIAKIMRNISHALGVFEHDELFERDIERYSAAIQNNLWDEDSGYYSYLEHDVDGNPIGFLRYKDGTNYNMGLDGAYPYIAGVSNEHQSQRILENIKEGMMTEYGLGVVDTRAPYYETEGYWNGSVWMPHQWILAKALLDRGEIDLAVKIWKTALKVWKREVERTYLCFEHFMSTNGRGAGFHQFSGLSSPILAFFESLYTPASVTVGFDTAVRCKWVSEDSTAIKVDAVSNSDGSVMVVCLSDKCKYKFTVNGKPVRAKRLTGGAYAIPLGKKGEKTVEGTRKQLKVEN